MSDLPLFDNDGFVNRPASINRAMRESLDGTRSARHAKIMKHLDWHGLYGATWRQLGEELRLHHGQISGALSKLHQNGEVFALRQQRDKCHPYVHIKYRDFYDNEDVFDEPVKTTARLNTELIDEIHTLLQSAILHGDWSIVNDCIQLINEKRK